MSCFKEEDEWELINDNGFVYKRKKRLRFDPISSTSSPPPDPSFEEKNSKKRKKKTFLTNLKKKYQTEILHWELLSNTLRDLNLRTRNLGHGFNQLDIIQQVVESPVKFSNCNLIDDILAQVEAQEVMMANVFNLCEATEALCIVQEEQSMQFFLDLPVWDLSPCELMNSF